MSDSSDSSPSQLAELHSHSHYSDGSFSPEEVVQIAGSAGLGALALTDHDTVAGVAAAQGAADQVGLQLIAGVEFSSHVGKREIHVVGLFIDADDPDLRAACGQARRLRRQRAEEIVGRLRELRLDLGFADVESAAAGASMGRPHIAAAMVEIGVVPDLDAAFRRYIGNGGPAFVPKPTLSANEVIEVIHRSGGTAVLAHPASSRVPERTIFALADIGLDGIEINHPKHGPQQRRRLRKLVERTGLLPSGGSDFHGPGSGRTPMGACAVPFEWMEALRNRAARYARHVS